MIKTKTDREKFNESEEIAKKHDYESEMMKKFLESSVKMKCR